MYFVNNSKVLYHNEIQLVYWLSDVP